MRSLHFMLRWTLAVALWGAAWPAQAYVLPADFLARLIADGRKPSLKDVTMHLSIEQSPQSPRVEGRLYFARPDRMRQVLLGTSERVEIVRGAERFLGDGQTQRLAGRSRNLLPLLFFPAGKDTDEKSASVLEGLAQAGIDTQTVSLARWQQGFAYVIGAQSWQTDRPQLWLDKASFAPIRLLWPSQADPAEERNPAASAEPNAPLPEAAAVHEIRLANYVGGLPRAIEEWRDGQRLYRAEATVVLVNQHLSPELFEPASGSVTRPPRRR